MMRAQRPPTTCRRLLLHLALAAACAVTLFALLPVGPGPVAYAQTTPPTPLPLYALPPARALLPSSNTMALRADGRTLVAVNMLSNSVSLLTPALGQVLAEIPVGLDPRGITITPNGRLALTANRGDNTLSILDLDARAVSATVPLGGAQPYGVVATDTTAYVTLKGSDEVAVVDIAARTVTQRWLVADAPAGLTLWGDFLYVSHFWSGRLTLIYTPQGRVVMETATGVDTGAFQSLTIDPDAGLAYLPQTRYNARNEQPTYDTLVFPVVNVMTLRDLSVRPAARLTLDTADRPVNLPFAVQLDAVRRWLYVANAGSNDVSVIDLKTGMARAHIPVGANPRGLLLSRDRNLLFVHNALDSTITVVDTASMAAVDVLPISSPAIPNEIFIGAQLFHSAADPRMSQDSWLSCATCHFDGESDGRVWVGMAGGPRNTPLLYGLPETAPYSWTGAMDELADVELMIRDLQGGLGLVEGLPHALRGEPHSGVSADLDTLVNYLISIVPPSYPPPPPDALVERGAEVFVEQNCAVCHVGRAGTNLQKFDVGTDRQNREGRNAAYDTPSLRWLWLSAPYFHDGAATTLRQVFEVPGEHQLIYDVRPQDIDALVAYLLAWPE